MKCYACNSDATLIACPRCGRAACNTHQAGNVPKFSPKFVCKSCADAVFAEIEAASLLAKKQQEQALEWKKKYEEEQKQRELYLSSTQDCPVCGGKNKYRTKCSLCDENRRVTSSKYSQYFNETEICSSCNGRTYTTYTVIKRCSECEGSGKVWDGDQTSSSGRMKCPSCRGKGEAPSEESSSCDKCDINGRMPKSSKRGFWNWF
jgi:DnaJ-class molecular chaperone